MQSFLSMLFFGFFLSLSLSLPNGGGFGGVDARIHAPVESVAIPANPAVTIGSQHESRQQQQQQQQQHQHQQIRSHTTPSLLENSFAAVEMVQSASRLLLKTSSHRSLGGGDSAAASNNERTLFQQQDWARDDDGNILWWIWLIIGLSIGLFCIVCCCSSACCLRD